MIVLIMSGTVSSHDAVGNDVEAMFEILSKRYVTYVYANNKNNKNVEYVEYAKALEIVLDENNLIIYHHCVLWEDGFELLKKSNSKIIIRYHNITPAAFFEKYSVSHFDACRRGSIQTLEIIESFPNAIWMPASEYNMSEIHNVKTKHFTLPPFNKLEKWGNNSLPDENIAGELTRSDDVNVLFVGRIVPNKGHINMFKVIKYYRERYSEKIKLRIVGKKEFSLSGYNDLLDATIRKYGISENVEFIGEVTDETLCAYYKYSDIFLCCSMHEGFGVPIAEAQFFGLPIIATDNAAVPETLGEEQIVMKDDPKEIAAAINILMSNDEYKSYLTEKGHINYDRNYARKVLESKLNDYVEDIVNNYCVQESIFSMEKRTKNCSGGVC